MENQSFISLDQVAVKKLIVPQAVFYLPVQYDLQWPTPFLSRNDLSRQLTPTKRAEVKLGNEWYDEVKKEYRKGEKEKEILLQAKPRPFLVLRRFRLKHAWSDGPFVLGLPITGVRNSMKDSKQKTENLQNNIYQNIYFLPLYRNKMPGLHKESVVVIAAPTYIPTEYFTHFMGFIDTQDMSAVVTRYKGFVQFGGGYMA